SIRDGRSRCAMPKAPRQRLSLHPPSRAQPRPETNSKLDRNWGQRQVLKAKPVRRLLRLGESPTRILAAAIVFANVVLDTDRRGVFGSWQSDFVAHRQQ
ncbi:hypothetical protein, partial [Mesorhizobium sp.]|uniref:hypothetical protein n=1 Tax=Mesorhizobium sp. TaxID=1871066 RepID=UPI0025D90044